MFLEVVSTCGFAGVGDGGRGGMGSSSWKISAPAWEVSQEAGRWAGLGAGHLGTFTGPTAEHIEGLR